MKLPVCPECSSDLTYDDGLKYVCPICGHEWPKESSESDNEAASVKDSNGNVLNDGDAVTVIKDLKVKGASNPIKQGTKVKRIRIIEPENGHDIECKIDGFGQIQLKSEYVKKLS